MVNMIDESMLIDSIPMYPVRKSLLSIHQFVRVEEMEIEHVTQVTKSILYQWNINRNKTQ